MKRNLIHNGLSLLAVTAALFLLAAAVVAVNSGFAQEDQDPYAEKLASLRATAVSLVEAYNKGDSAGVAASYLPDGELVLASGEVISGRDDIQAFYDGVFAGDEDPQTALEAGSVRFITPTLAIEEGTFHVTMAAGEIQSHNYSAVLVQQDDGSWLTATVRDQSEDVALPEEKLIALEWIIGDWILEKDGTRTFISFDWSDDGPFIDARALTEEAGFESTSATMRIGWDAKRDGYVSWNFDALGGYNYGEWTADGNDTYLIRLRGVTADGESNRATHVFGLDPSRQNFTWTTRDQVIGTEVQPTRTVRAVKRPPAPKSAQSE